MIRRWLFAVVMLASVVLPFLPAGEAQAAPFARAVHKGYFFNGDDNAGGFVIRAGVHETNASDFIGYIKARLASANEQDQTGAEFIVLTMLGYPAGTTKATAHLPAVISKWQSDVLYYASKGWINWHANYSYAFNTYWQGKNGGGTNPDDDAWFNDSGSTGPDGAIVFHQPGGGTYAIRKECANPLGVMNKLVSPPPPPPVNFNVSLIANSNGTPLTVVGGQASQIKVQVTNAGPANSQAGVIQIQRPAAVAQPCAPTCNDPGQNALLFGPTGPGGHNYRAASGITGVIGSNWQWSVNPLGNGVPAGSVLNWTVPLGTPVGTIITFDVYYAPADLAGAVRHVPVSFRVVSERTPSVVGMNGDVHAGGGLCAGTQTNGTIKGYPGAGSGGQYVVTSSTATGISGFASNGTGADDLKATGYAQICRPDLVKVAADYRLGTGWSSTGAADFDVTGKSGVYFLDAATTTIHGTVSSPVTIVGKALIISNTIQIDPASHPIKQLPSLGVIASGTISIRAAVTRVDAYLFSNATIDTCMEGNVAATKLQCATPTLVINGFIMAKDMAFHRIGPVDINGKPVAEQVILNPQIYLNPPKLMDASIDDTLLEGQGEKQPLF